MKLRLLMILLTITAIGCTAAPVSTAETSSLQPKSENFNKTNTGTPPPSPSWEFYNNEPLGFSLEHPTEWVVVENGAESGFIGNQVFWWTGDYDPTKQPGDRPAVDQIIQVEVNGKSGDRILGHYLGAIGDMGHQQYLRYVFEDGALYYTFTLYAVNTLGIPQEMMSIDPLPLSENDIQLFEQMMATLKFNN